MAQVDHLLPDFFQGRRVSASDKAYTLYCISRILELGRSQVVNDMQRNIEEINAIAGHEGVSTPAPVGHNSTFDISAAASSISTAHLTTRRRKRAVEEPMQDTIKRRRSHRIASRGGASLPAAGSTPIASKARHRRSPPPPMPPPITKGLARHCRAPPSRLGSPSSFNLQTSQVEGL